MEIWKDVLGYEELYMMSSLGRIKLVKTGLIMKHWTNWAGYKLITLCKNKGKRSHHKGWVVRYV